MADNTEGAANYKPYTVVVLDRGRTAPREVPKFCAAARMQVVPVGDGRVEHHPAPHDFRPTYNDIDGPGAICASCLLALGSNDLQHLHETYYNYPMTTEGSAEVPAGESLDSIWLDLFECYEMGQSAKKNGKYQQASAWRRKVHLLQTLVESTAAAAERTRLRADVVWVTRDEAAWLDKRKDIEDEVAALRAAVRPLVEAAKAIESARTFDLGWRGEGEPPRCIEVPAVVWRAFIAALADPAIAALLEGGNDGYSTI